MVGPEYREIKVFAVNGSATIVLDSVVGMGRPIGKAVEPDFAGTSFGGIERSRPASPDLINRLFRGEVYLAASSCMRISLCG